MCSWRNRLLHLFRYQHQLYRQWRQARRVTGKPRQESWKLHGLYYGTSSLFGGLLSQGMHRTKPKLGCSGRPALPVRTAQNETLSRPNRADSPTHIPQYVLDYAPSCYLYSGEEYWPGKMEVHLDYTTPHVDYDDVPEEFQNPTLDDLDKLNHFGRNAFLQSHDDPDSYPDWIAGRDNIPNDPNYWMRKDGRRRRRITKSNNVSYRSDAPVVLVVVDKGEYVDAFWFFFYSFNLGNAVFGLQFGNHVGDWEHTAVRFQNGKPIHIFYSEHEWGAAYKWEDAEKHGERVSLIFSISLSNIS